MSFDEGLRLYWSLLLFVGVLVAAFYLKRFLMMVGMFFIFGIMTLYWRAKR